MVKGEVEQCFDPGCVLRRLAPIATEVHKELAGHVHAARLREGLLCVAADRPLRGEGLARDRVPGDKAEGVRVLAALIRELGALGGVDEDEAALQRVADEVEHPRDSALHVGEGQGRAAEPLGEGRVLFVGGHRVQHRGHQCAGGRLDPRHAPQRRLVHAWDEHGRVDVEGREDAEHVQDPVDDCIRPIEHRVGEVVHALDLDGLDAALGGLHAGVRVVRPRRRGQLLHEGLRPDVEAALDDASLAIHEASLVAALGLRDVAGAPLVAVQERSLAQQGAVDPGVVPGSEPQRL
mmetsp:Transcript_64038/g.179159  ORF Transcript_64038/g.179159 Transcript_64038/m.179159 type:complete len:293 (+) Transcript_64038:216-1094(+)